jgi:hypothetical protein
MEIWLQTDAERLNFIKRLITLSLNFVLDFLSGKHPKWESF